MEAKLKKLKKFLVEERKDCFEQEEEGTLTIEGENMILMINLIYKYMNWKPIKFKRRKICKLTKEENKIWSKIYMDNYLSAEFSEEEAYNLTTKVIKRKFPKLKDYDKLI